MWLTPSSAERLPKRVQRVPRGRELPVAGRGASPEPLPKTLWLGGVFASVRTNASMVFVGQLSAFEDICKIYIMIYPNLRTYIVCSTNSSNIQLT